MNIYYKNSKTASALCIIGYVFGICGAIAFIDEKSLEYLLVSVVGIALAYAGTRIGGKADFGKWIAAQDKAKMEKQIGKSLTFAMEKYQECPNRYTYEYINKLNPEAGTYIKKDRAESRKNLMLKGKDKKTK